MLILFAVLSLVIAAMVYHFVTGEGLRKLPHRKLKPLLCRIRSHCRSGRHIHKIATLIVRAARAAPCRW